MHAILTKVRENCELRNLAENTQLSYSRHIRQFFDFFPERKPNELGTEEIREYLLHLKRDKKRAIRTLDVAYSFLKFLYNTDIRLPRIILHIFVIIFTDKPVLLSPRNETQSPTVIEYSH